ncbi:MAG TPA: hypothetical protein EYH09_02125, partial [Candidatus Nanopusillus sp.]|nr:hypothetical protein [Candidatus Nanopusillus sp.]
MVIRTSVEYIGSGKVLIIDAKEYPKLATIEDDPNIMSLCIQKISEDPTIIEINIEQEELISYYEDTIMILKQFADVYLKIKQILREYYSYLLSANPLFHEYKNILDVLDREYLYDPIGAYVKVKRWYRRLNLLISQNPNLERSAIPLIQLISTFVNTFESLSLYEYIKDFIPGYKIGDRSIYKRLFVADIKPKFISIKYLSKIPEDAEIIETYSIDNETEVTIFRKPNEIIRYYYIFPEEYKLYEEELMLINKAREVLIQYQPKREDYLDPERLKEIYEKIIDNILISLSKTYNVVLTQNKIKKLRSVLIRYTIGFGILEKVAKDENVQDIFVNPPPGTNPISLI